LKRPKCSNEHFGRTKMVQPANWLRLKVLMSVAAIFGLVALAIPLVYGWAGLCVSLFPLSIAVTAPLLATERTVYCSFCGQAISTSCLKPVCKCGWCGQVHAIKWY
jgi:hypothetical protein